MPATDVIVRVAPSPTGFLQVGNGRAAVLNALFARKSGGKFMLRIDDTDPGRSRVEYELAAIEDYAWLGITHDLFARASDRVAIYQAAADKLRAAGRLYPCYETPEELERRRKRQMAAHKPPIYDRAALNLTAEERARLEAEGRKPHWRFKLTQTKAVWHDLIRGPVEIDTATQSDPVLIREDGSFLYMLPSVVDDIEFGITHIMRGEDHVTNTAPQIEIFEALGAAPPQFAHYALFVGADGGKLSKRAGGLSLRDLRAEGIEPLTLASYLAKMGTSDPIEPRLSLDALANEFAFEKIGRALAHFDTAELALLNGKLLHLLPYDTVAHELTALGITGGPAFWEAVRPNLTKLADAVVWQSVVTGPVSPVIENADLTSKAATLLPPEPWDETTWGTLTKAVADATGAKGRALFHPLRLALTGRGDGPELKKLLPLIGRARALARLNGETA
ncbi:MAG: glutamate--tRNA ligase [Alphaproteobacteria bacterium]|nr:glutamate--tRNA ligase [Alphaproteobacteria bacterium]MBV9542018.1 glutamate--tRNA ligase [Alphaproteobacteria bacterium]MBV9904221.1 glutamate--tRNA ligase [Alphaproteobacteria bacterium]